MLNGSKVESQSSKTICWTRTPKEGNEDHSTEKNENHRRKWIWHVCPHTPRSFNTRKWPDYLFPFLLEKIGKICRVNSKLQGTNYIMCKQPTLCSLCNLTPWGVNFLRLVLSSQLHMYLLQGNWVASCHFSHHHGPPFTRPDEPFILLHESKARTSITPYRSPLSSLFLSGHLQLRI